MTKRNSPLIRIYRIARLALHLLYGMATAATIYAAASSRWQDRLARRWSRKALAIVHVRCTTHGKLAEIPPQGMLIVANHISWLDIYLINHLHQAHFVSKAEVRNWPLIGWLAEKVGTLFIERSRKRDAHRINDSIRETLKRAELVVVFPEGTTTDGSRIRTFHASLLQPAIDCGSLVQPVTIRYRYDDGTPNVTPAYVDKMSFGDSLRRIASEKEIRAELTFLEPINPAGKTRRELALLAETAIANALHLASPRSGTGKHAGLPGATH